MKAIPTEGSSVLLFMSRTEARRLVQLYYERARPAAEVDDLDRGVAALCLELDVPFTRNTPKDGRPVYTEHPTAAPIREAAARVKAAAPKQRQPEAAAPPTKPDKAKATGHRPAAAARPAKRKHVSPLAYSEEVRAWARANKIQVGINGRMSNDVVTAYQAAHHRPAAKFSG